MTPKKTAAHRCAAVRFLLSAQTELLDQSLVALVVLALEVIKQAATAVNHLQQTAAAVVVLLVELEVTGELLDAGGQESHLDFRGAGVGRAALVFFDDLAGV